MADIFLATVTLLILAALYTIPTRGIWRWARGRNWSAAISAATCLALFPYAPLVGIVWLRYRWVTASRS